MKRILLIVNKNWEAEPILSALLNKKFKPANLKDPDLIYFPRTHKQGEAFPRGTWQLQKFVVELWCIENIMEPNPDPEKLKAYYSSSEQKNIDLKKIFSYSKDEVGLVAAIGTAGSPGSVSRNGCVVIGSNIFIHDGHPPGDPNIESKWHETGWFEKLITSTIDENFFASLRNELGKASQQSYFEKRFLRPPLNGLENPLIFCDREWLGVSNVNVTRYHEYEKKDEEALEALAKATIKEPLGSLETTHGVIRAHAGNAPFIFISAIVDRIGYFAEDVDPKEMAQNFSGSFNAGIVIGFLIPFFDNNL